MAQPHAFTTNYDLLKIGLGSNAFNNPYHILYSQTMDIIDAQLWADEQSRDAFGAPGFGFISHIVGEAQPVASEPLRLHQQAGWHTNNSVQVSSDVGQSPFAQDLISASYINPGAVLQIALFPAITGNPLPLSRFGLYLTAAGASKGFTIIAYSSNAAGSPAELLDESDLITGPPPDYFLPAGLNVCAAGGMPTLESQLPGLLVWIGFTRQGNADYLPCKALAAPRGAGGYSDGGVPMTGVHLLSPVPLPPASWPTSGTEAWAGGSPFIFRTT